MEEEEIAKNERERTIQELDIEINQCKASITVAEDLILDAQKNLNEALSEKVLKGELIQQASSKLTVGNERKRKFQEDLIKLQKKRAKKVKKKWSILVTLN